MMENSRLTFLLMLILVFSKTSLIGQIQKSPTFSFCNNKGETIELKELKKCPKLTSTNKKVKIKSYLVAIPVKMDQEQVEDISQLGKEVMYVEYKIIGDELSSEAIGFFERSRKGHLKVSIEEVVVIEDGKESKYDGFTFYLK